MTSCAANAKNALAYARVWHEIDASGQIVGRLANRIVHVLLGKHKPIYHPKIDCGDYVVIKNCKQAVWSGTKAEDKTYTYYSGYPGGLKVRPIRRYMDLYPEKILQRAVYGMLPRAKRVRLNCMSRLFIYSTSDHPHKENIFRNYLGIDGDGTGGLHRPNYHSLFSRN
jgi:large subunit ribosomal protein L13